MEARLMRPRLEQEFAMLAKAFPGALHQERSGEEWFYVPNYPFPEGWELDAAPASARPVCFMVGAGYPATQPYAFLIPERLTYRSQVPDNGQLATNIPFGGQWRQLSWTWDDWTAGASPELGGNLLTWARSFGHRLKEGK